MNFTELFKKYSSYVYNYALKLSCNPNVAEDISQETFLKAWEKRDQLQKKESAVKSLLYRARMNLDDFFSKHCDLIKIDNPCNCKAWVELI